MANEATLVIETELPLPFTCADGTAIPKGSSLKIADLATVSLAAADEDYCGGIAGTEKIASDGMVRMDVYRGGIFKVTASGSITAGQTVAHSSVDNKFKVTDATCIGNKAWGVALETASADETFLMELRPGCGVVA